MAILLNEVLFIVPGLWMYGQYMYHTCRFKNHKVVIFHNFYSRCGKKLKKGQSRLLYGVDDEFTSVALVGLGKKNKGYDEQEEIYSHRDNIRGAVAGRYWQ
jgi:hypothetical protein